MACNFDHQATLDDGSCEFESCGGCLVSWACNYTPNASFNDGTCVFPDLNGLCPNDCLSDADGDGVCDELEVTGCTYMHALNYAADATEDDGSCAFTGCNPNHPVLLSTDELSSDGCGYDVPRGDFTGDALVAMDDLLLFLAAVGMQGPPWGAEWIQQACAIAPLSLADVNANPNGCVYPSASNYDQGSDADAGTCIWLGCSDITALNYGPWVTHDDGSCRYHHCPDFDNDHHIGIVDLLEFLSFWGD
jgi:hypothetical protein